MAPLPSRRALIAGIASAALVGLAGCRRRRTPGAIRIANASGGLNLTMAALMRQQRFMQSVGLTPEFLDVADGSRIVGGIIGGSVDASFMSGFGQAFPAIAHGADIKIIGGGILLPALGLFTANPRVRTLKDLEGRTVGSGSVGALTYQLTVTLLRRYGVDLSKVRFVNVGSSADIWRSVSAGAVDAGVGQLSHAAVAGRARLIPHGNMALELRQFTYQGAWTTGHLITTHRDLLVKALAAHAKLYRFVQQPSSRDAFLKARRSVFPSASAADHAAEWNYIQTYKPFAVDLVLSPERLLYMQQLNIGFGLQKTLLPPEQVADMTLARDALASLAGG